MAVKDYLNVITSEHRQQPKFIATATAYFDHVEEARRVVDSFDQHFGLEDGVGKQLDMLGESIGRTRTLPFQPEGYSAKLDDDSYRLVLKAKILQNQWDGTIAGMGELFGSIFPNLKLEIIDYQDMSMQVNVLGLEDNMQLQLLNQGYVIPKPEGVRLKIVFVIVVDQPVTAYFGSALQTGTEMSIYPVFSDELTGRKELQLIAYYKQGTTLSVYPEMR